MIYDDLTLLGLKICWLGEWARLFLEERVSAGRGSSEVPMATVGSFQQFSQDTPGPPHACKTIRVIFGGVFPDYGSTRAKTMKNLGISRK